MPRRWSAPCLCALACAALPACGPLPWSGGGRIPDRTPESVAERYDAMCPVALRVHPLTRLELPDDGPVRLALHVELLDRYDEGVRWLGDLHVELLRAGSEGGGGGETAGVRELVYDKPLTNPGENNQAWDRVTRTYTIFLADLPEWARSPEARVPIRVVFTFIAADGTPRSLEAGGTARR